MTIERIGEHPVELQSRVDTSKPKLPDLDNQFEAVLLQTMLKTSCIDQHFTDVSSSFISPSESDLPHTLTPGTVSTEIKPITPEAQPASISQSVDGFLKSIWPYARQVSSLIGLDPKILIAQAALETGWGKFIAKDTDGSSSNNLFNIKAKKIDQSVTIQTTEYTNDAPIKMMAAFKKYPTIEQSFKDYMSLINGERYKTALANAHDPQRYIAALHQAGYATDPDYANKILSIYHGDELRQALERNGCI